MIAKSSILAAALCLGCAAGHAQAVRPGAAPSADAEASAHGADNQLLFAEGLRMYRAGRWSAAYGRFIELADRGHVPSSRIALQMLRHGRDLYGTDWTAAPSQVAGWERNAAGSRPLKVAVLGE